MTRTQARDLIDTGLEDTGLQLLIDTVNADRPIPACAGEPQPASHTASTRVVYPRVCGGTESLRRQHGDDRGLSPRVRGNHRYRRRAIRQSRSIPACAGEPFAPLFGAKKNTVYPRVCGGTCPTCSTAVRAAGLSPRVRGNPSAIIPAPVSMRSIPACAGEP